MHNAMTPTRRQFLRIVAGAGAGGVARAALATRPAKAAAESAPYKIGIYTRPWGQFDYRFALDAIAAAGFHQVGLMTTTHKDPAKGHLVLSTSTTSDEARRIGQDAAARGLEVASVYGGGIPVNKSLEAGIQGLRKLIDNCVAAGAKSLLMGGTGDTRLYDRYYAAIARCCDYAANQHLPITVKPHGGLNSTGPQCRKCLETVNHPNFSLWYDPGNVFYYSDGKLDPVDDAKTVNGLVRVGMCIKDFQMKDKDGTPTPDVQLTPGTGRVDFQRVLRILRAGGFRRGHLVIECLDPGDGTPRSLLREAKKARAFCQQTLEFLQ